MADCPLSCSNGRQRVNEFSVPRKWREFRNISIHEVAVHHRTVEINRRSTKTEEREEGRFVPKKLGGGEGKKENLLKSKYASKVFCSRMERAIMYVNGTRSEKGARARPIGVRYRYRGVSADNK